MLDRRDQSSNNPNKGLLFLAPKQKLEHVLRFIMYRRTDLGSLVVEIYAVFVDILYIM